MCDDVNAVRCDKRHLTSALPANNNTHTNHQSQTNERRSERVNKYNQLLRIEEELGDAAVYAGDNWRYIALA
jgi:hypothetical protein